VKILDGLIDGVRSALSYGGASNLGEFQPEYVRVTSTGINEAHPHLVR
jgi:IMP dehydrogenase/GMP reductase